ncbi:MAG: LacI family transcriptional regulator [Paenibacillaceae bacterium]|nr:LacI family transcriptional regulator [Paenibacillaceae bacterium]
MSVTIKEVARRAGVSISTVSRVMAGEARVRPENRRKVESIVKEMDYSPNSTAQSLVSHAANAIGLLLTEAEAERANHPFGMELIRGAVTRANRSGFDLFIGSGSGERAGQKVMSRLVRGKRVDGAIVLAGRHKEAVIDWMRTNGAPFVLIGRSEQEGVPSVDIDNEAAGYEAAYHLIRLGHKRIGFVGLAMERDAVECRLRGYKRALRDNGLSWRSGWILEEELLRDGGDRAMAYLTSLLQRPTALVAADDMTALSVIRALHNLELRVPADMAVVGFDNTPLAELSVPPLSSIDTGAYHLGYWAADRLLRMLRQTKNGAEGSERLVVPHKLVVRESSMPVRGPISPS